jgi:hypothetical protein
MHRNMDESKHWPFDPKQVGRDPEGEMPRLTPALLLQNVELGGAIVDNGSCHSAVTRRAMVGPDIVSTFGDTDGKVLFFDIDPKDSFPLQAIAHGAGAYIGPLAANNAPHVARVVVCFQAASVGECRAAPTTFLVMGRRSCRSSSRSSRTAIRSARAADVPELVPPRRARRPRARAWKQALPPRTRSSWCRPRRASRSASADRDRQRSWVWDPRARRAAAASAADL